MPEFHDVAALFPLMDGEEFELLKADIAAHGLREPIWLHPDGRIIDGRNRYRACLETDTAPRYRAWDGTGSLVSLVVSLNLKRRHLTKSQLAAIALEVKEALAQEIAAEAVEKKRRAALEREAQKRRDAKNQAVKPLTEDEQNHSSPILENCGRDAAQEAAAVMGVGHAYIYDAAKLKDEAPDLFQDVYAKYRIARTMTTSTKGLLATNIVVALLRRNLIALPFSIDVTDDKALQISGTDILIHSKVRLQVKCDFNAGDRRLGGTGNLFLQTEECNPYRLY